MERRDFMKTAVATSACAASTLVLRNRAHAQEAKKSYACKLTVLRRTLNQDFADKYREGRNSLCDRFNPLRGIPRTLVRGGIANPRFGDRRSNACNGQIPRT